MAKLIHWVTIGTAIALGASAVVAGNIFRGKCLGIRLPTLKALYYVLSAGDLKASLLAWSKRRQATHEPATETTAS